MPFKDKFHGIITFSIGVTFELYKTILLLAGVVFFLHPGYWLVCNYITYFFARKNWGQTRNAVAF